MTRRRPSCAVCAAVLFLFLVGARFYSLRAQSPAPSPRVLIDRSAPPAIERGISPLMTQAPGTPEMRRHGTFRPMSRVVDRTGASGARYLPGRVIVKFRDGASMATRVGAMRAVSRTATLSTRPRYANFDVVAIDPGEDAEATARALGQRPDVEYAQPAYRVRPQFVPNDFYYSKQWNLRLIDMERAWDVQPTAGSQVIVAVIDTGVAYTNATVRFHANAFTDDSGTDYPALGDLTLNFVAASELGPSSRFVSPHDFIWDDELPIDLDGHGTHISGTIGELTNNGSNGQGDVANGGGAAGVAFNVRLMPVKVVDTDWDDIFGSPNQGTDDVVARGIRYAADNGAKILNMSIGRTGPAAPVIEDALRYAVGKGCFVAISAGNDFDAGNPTEVISEIANRIDGAVSVAAVDPNKNHAPYSSSGSYIELAAPGGDFGSFGADGGILQQTLDLDLVDTFDLSPAQFTAPRFDALAYYYFIGTSSAAPHVSGVAAMLAQQGVTNPAAIEAALKRVAVRLGTTDASCTTAKRDVQFGCGLIEARSALRGLGLAR